MKTLADLLRRIADRLDPPPPRDPFAGMMSPIELPPTLWIGLPATQTITPIELPPYATRTELDDPEGKFLLAIDGRVIRNPFRG